MHVADDCEEKPVSGLDVVAIAETPFHMFQQPGKIIVVLMIVQKISVLSESMLASVHYLRAFEITNSAIWSARLVVVVL